MKNIYVGNLSYDAGEEELREVFEAFGTVTSITVIKDRDTGRSRGFAFVEMANDEEADAAIEGLNQQDHMGRALNVNETRPKSERARRGGGGGGGGGW